MLDLMPVRRDHQQVRAVLHDVEQRILVRKLDWRDVHREDDQEVIGDVRQIIFDERQLTFTKFAMEVVAFAINRVKGDHMNFAVGEGIVGWAVHTLECFVCQNVRTRILVHVMVAHHIVPRHTDLGGAYVYVIE